jgi:hypothetical protein
MVRIPTVYGEGHGGDRGPLPPPFLQSFFIATAPPLPCSPTPRSSFFIAPLLPALRFAAGLLLRFSLLRARLLGSALRCWATAPFLPASRSAARLRAPLLGYCSDSPCFALGCSAPRSAVPLFPTPFFPNLRSAAPRSGSLLRAQVRCFALKFAASHSSSLLRALVCWSALCCSAAPRSAASRLAARCSALDCSALGCSLLRALLLRPRLVAAPRLVVVSAASRCSGGRHPALRCSAAS